MVRLPPRKPPPGSASESRADAEAANQEFQVEDRVRTAKYRKMENSVQGFYIMLGGALSVMPPQMAGAQVKRIGRSFAVHSEQLADAWIDLAEDDPRVRRIIESITGVGAWGTLLGRHLEAIGDETPAIQAVRQQGQAMPQQPPPSDDVAAAMALADFFVQSAAQQRQTNGQEQAGPSPEQVRRAMEEAARQQQRPQRQQQQQPMAEPQYPMGAGAAPPVAPNQAPPMGQTRKPVGMPTPADLGVTFADAPEDFPAPGIGGEADVKG